MKSSRSNFTSRIGFILSAAGSAVGLGNIWRFPYLAAQYGGGTFLLCYIILAVTFGFALMTAEIALGRKTGLSAIGAFSALNKRYRFVGVLVTLVPVIIFPYYSVIGGWVIKYFFTFLTGGVSAAAEDTYFTGFISGVSEPIIWFVIFTAITAAVVICGVEKGIEKVSKVMMPLLVVLTVGISLYVLTIDGAMEGVKYYVLPHMSDFSIKTLLSSMGQLFYSMSLAMGIMITYGSYMSKSTNLESSVRQIEIFDTGIAFFAGLMIVPAVFAFSGGDPSALKAGPGLMFITLPKVFASIRFGGFLGTVFFVLVFFAAITSAISLMETIVSILMDFFHWSRRKTSILVFIYSLLMGVPSSLGFGIWDFVKPLGMSILDAWDFISNSILMPIVALLTCFFAGFVIKPKAIIEEACAEGAVFKGKHLFTVVIKWVAPIILVAILISSILNALGIFVM
ncbi:sodium-dependent transporter [Schaedlerella arabinosiphila]|uniref:Transporter n=1 Tax=Schaedlerella arabinosiphila TaxID=2044587 RepID=A0A426DGL4_9FIRM|nr:sodium-dependent transporter [Schaedlerella arabinosiphila]RRK31997.1 sodium-dependent transporter [Schaedlerella arabinosiphila]